MSQDKNKENSFTVNKGKKKNHTFKAKKKLNHQVEEEIYLW